MKLLVPRGLERVKQRWKSQYFTKGVWRYMGESVYERLEALPPDATFDAIDTAIGNDSWTTNTCDDCGHRGHETMVQLGEEPDYESSTTIICKRCLEEAYWSLL